MLLCFYFHALVGVVIPPPPHVNLITLCHIDTPSPYHTILIVITPHCHEAISKSPGAGRHRMSESSEAEKCAKCVLQGCPCHAASATQTIEFSRLRR